MITVSVWKQTKDPAKCREKPIQPPHRNQRKQGETFPHDSGPLPHLLCVEQTASESRGNVTYPVEKDEGDALSEVWAHEPLKGLLVPPLAWIITLRSPVMCRRWYMGPHLLLLSFHLLPKPPINKKNPGSQQDCCISNDCRLRSVAKTPWPIWWKLEPGSHLPGTRDEIPLWFLLSGSRSPALLILAHNYDNRTVRLLSSL